MGSLAELTNAGEELIPGHTLARPRLQEYAKAEEHFTAEYLATLKKACAGLPREVAADVMIAAAQDIKVGAFKYPGQVFTIHALSQTSLPFLVMWSLQVNHPDMTLAKVAELLAKAENLPDIAAKAWELWGYVPSKKPDAGAGMTESQSTGPASSDSSAEPPPASDTPPSNSPT